MAKVSLDTKVPDFSLKDFHGNDFILSEYENKNNLLLVFNRGFV